MCELNVMIRRLRISRFLNKYKFEDVALKTGILSLEYTLFCGTITAKLLEPPEVRFHSTKPRPPPSVCSNVTSHFEDETLHISQFQQLATGCLSRLSSFIIFLKSSHDFLHLPLYLLLTFSTTTLFCLALALSRALFLASFLAIATLSTRLFSLHLECVTLSALCSRSSSPGSNSLVRLSIFYEDLLFTSENVPTMKRAHWNYAQS
jgi:hypothetical protein